MNLCIFFCYVILHMNPIENPYHLTHLKNSTVSPIDGAVLLAFFLFLILLIRRFFICCLQTNSSSALTGHHKESIFDVLLCADPVCRFHIRAPAVNAADAPDCAEDTQHRPPGYWQFFLMQGIFQL